VADPDWADPLDSTWAERLGGRWNPPGSFRTLYLNVDPTTARSQLTKLLRGSPVRVEDLDDGAYVLVAATLPRNQTCAEALSDAGLMALGLPASYPLDRRGHTIPRGTCQPVGQEARSRALRGVACRSAATADGHGRELAWFPATTRSHAHLVWERPLELGDWRSASSWKDLDLPDQPEP
jgi:hypothetical protein